MNMDVNQEKNRKTEIRIMTAESMLARIRAVDEILSPVRVTANAAKGL